MASWAASEFIFPEKTELTCGDLLHVDLSFLQINFPGTLFCIVGPEFVPLVDSSCVYYVEARHKSHGTTFRNLSAVSLTIVDRLCQTLSGKGKPTFEWVFSLVLIITEAFLIWRK